MKAGLYAVFDKKAVSYSPPFLQPSDGAALRFLLDMMSDSQSVICKHPADFQLVKVGEYELETGSISPLQTEVLAEALSLKEMQT